MKTMIASDVHLGSPSNRCTDLIWAIRHELPERLILNGDVLSDTDFSRLSRADWNFLGFIADLATRCEVVWVRGNHDIGVSDHLGQLMGISIVDEYWFQWGSKTCVAIHGHQFDKLIMKHQRLSELVSRIYLELQKVRLIREYVAKWAELKADTWQRLELTVADGAYKYAKANGAEIIFCGHTHQMFQIWTEIRYINSGCWVRDRCTYVILTDDDVYLETFGG